MPKAKPKEPEAQTVAAAEAVTETVQRFPLSELHPFEGHPFKVLDDDAMAETVESIRMVGIANPLIVRPDPDGGYEIISGHRRHHAAELAGLDAIPVIVRELDDDAAVIMMVDSNLQRENILPSERAKAYKMKMDALRHQGQRTDLTSPQVAAKFRADDEVGKGAGVSGDTVRRFVRLTNLIPEILDMVDEKKISMTPAVELSYLKPEEQRNFLEAMDYAQAAPSVSQAQRMKKKSQEDGCTLEDMCGIMDEAKKDDMGQIAFKTSDLQKFFPKSYTPRQMSDTILRLLEQWQRRRQRNQQR
ncbi:ParB-like partition protein [Anaerotruncus sp. G3(2012)]|uniref:ParB/RepB/Spo0J family partition protein n=1 Tax=Anaerotruncus sp. G3(2012) TaxID=1235835 RepID=UPI00033F5680|nr:ParB/RepB/Spo0J family partition protein [Anaerotruncus sp. G3(2012)]EOS58889.1 ParB-like partition protein [Anaerotruncus sp. G3(2012)]